MENIEGQKRVQALLNKNPELTTHDIFVSTGIPKRTLQSWLKDEKVKKPVPTTGSIKNDVPYAGEVIRMDFDTERGGRVYIESVDAETEEQALARVGIDLKQYKKTKVRYNEYRVTMKLKRDTDENEAGQFREHPYKAVNHCWSFEFKPREDYFALEALDQILNSYEPPEVYVSHITKSPNGELCVWAPYDHHFGMLSWEEETGFNSDLSDQKEKHAWATGELLNRLDRRDIKEFYYPLGNDVFHINDQTNVTPASGNRLDVDGRPIKVFHVGTQATIDSIYMLLEKAPVRIGLQQGNHDPYTSYYLATAIYHHFYNHPHVEVDMQPRDRKYITHGNVFLGFTHKINPSRSGVMHAINTFMREFGVPFAQSNWHDIFCGHLHHKKKKSESPVNTEQDGDLGVNVNWLPSLSAPDIWHYTSEYVCNHMRTEAYLYNDEALISVENIVI